MANDLILLWLMSQRLIVWCLDCRLFQLEDAVFDNEWDPNVLDLESGSTSNPKELPLVLCECEILLNTNVFNVSSGSSELRNLWTNWMLRTLARSKIFKILSLENKGAEGAVGWLKVINLRAAFCSVKILCAIELSQRP